MKVAYLAAGAAGMYCGSCMRDNRLAAALIAMGRDVVLMPLYTPLRTDETDVSRGPIYYGGVNVYLQHESRVFRKTPSFVDRALDSPMLLRAVSRLASRNRAEDLGPLTVSVLQGAHGPQIKELSRLISALQELKPTIINLPNLMFVGVAESLKKALNVPIVCTLAGEDVFLDALVEPHRTHAFELIRAGAEYVDAFITPTRYYGAHAAGHFALDPDRVHYVPMGICLDDLSAAAVPADEPFVIGYLGRICPEKGLAVLADAFIRLRAQGRRCRLRAAGYLPSAEKPYLRSIVARIRSAGLADDFEFLGEVTREQKNSLLHSLHVLSVPAVYAEAKGFYVLEAMASGVPVVQPNHGSFPELLNDAGGGVLYDVGDEHGLTNAIGTLMDDSDLRRCLAEQGRKSVRDCHTDVIMAERTWELYERLCA